MNRLAYVGMVIFALMIGGCAKVAQEPLFSGNDSAKYVNVHCGDGATSLQGNAPFVTGAIAGKLDSFTVVVVGDDWSDEVLIAAINRPCGLEETIQSIFDANAAP